MTKKVFVLFGTRPEAIKLFPVIKQLNAKEGISVTVCVTGQHREMLDQVLKLTEIVPDVDLDLMRANQTLDELTARGLTSVGQELDRVRPDWVVVQGDTTTTMVGALAAYYRRIAVAHVEAGLRTGDNYAPWPEEVNRKIVTAIAELHFAPTKHAAETLRAENVPVSRIHVTGNTVVDALLAIRELIEPTPEIKSRWDELRRRRQQARVILLTAHRRESHGRGLENLADAILQLASRPDVFVVLPLHPNPNVTSVLGTRLAQHPRVQIIEPPAYLDFVALLSLADLVLTDSGGIQEEAPTFGKPVLVLRDTTERPEGIEAGTARLVGTDTNRIVREVMRLLEDPEHYKAMSHAHNPYGDGHASERIAKLLIET
jgi:UDP-N-acetylglucosamine 2-epimerase (non-hydrolysing)